jgi:hypothetical protein
MLASTIASCPQFETRSKWSAVNTTCRDVLSNSLTRSPRGWNPVDMSFGLIERERRLPGIVTYLVRDEEGTGAPIRDVRVSTTGRCGSA